MTRAANVHAIEEATNTSWAEWLVYLESIGAKDLSHKEIAEKVNDKLRASHGSSGWWAQGIAVAYEQHIGRREPGQRTDGSFEISVSRTFDTPSLDAGMDIWLKLVKDRNEFAGVKTTKEPLTTHTPNKRHWSCGLSDGTRISVDVYPKINHKVSLTITHHKITSSEAAEKWRAYWKEFLDNAQAS